MYVRTCVYMLACEEEVTCFMQVLLCYVAVFLSLVKVSEMICMYISVYI